MKRNSMNHNRTKQPNMLIMLGIALGAILLLLPSLGFTQQQTHVWDFDYDDVRATYLYDSFGHWWDPGDPNNKKTGIYNEQYITFVEIAIPEIPRVTPLPWLGINRIEDNSTGSEDHGGYVKIFTRNELSQKPFPNNYDNPVEGKFEYAAYFRLPGVPEISLPSLSSCFKINATTCGGPNGETDWAGCRPSEPTDPNPTPPPPLGGGCCEGIVARNCVTGRENSCNAWYDVVEVGGDASIGAPIYVAYDNTVRGLFTNRLTIHPPSGCGIENPDELIAEVAPEVFYKVEPEVWYYVYFVVERYDDDGDEIPGEPGEGARETLGVWAYREHGCPGRWERVAGITRNIQRDADPEDPDANIYGVPLQPIGTRNTWHITLGSNSGGHSYYFDGLIDRVIVLTNMIPIMGGGGGRR